MPKTDVFRRLITRLFGLFRPLAFPKIKHIHLSLLIAFLDTFLLLHRNDMKTNRIVNLKPSNVYVCNMGPKNAKIVSIKGN